MEDPVSISFHTLDRMAEKAMRGELAALDVSLDRARVEAFLRRTGRPLPKVIVLGRDMAMRCRQVDELGGDAVGVDGGENVISLARALYPNGTFEQADIRDLPVEKSMFDGAWTSTILEHVPIGEVVKTMQSIHDALRPGGLLYTRFSVGDDEGFEETEFGPIYRVKWAPDQLAEVLGALNFDLLATEEFEDNTSSLLLRREY